MKTSDSIAKISPAVVKALAAIKGAPKDRANTHFKNQYATLESVIEASRDILATNDLCAFQTLGAVSEGRLTVTTRLLHTSGEYIESDFEMPVGKLDPQGTGSASTNGRRYALMAALNMAPIDDDGEAAMDRAGEAFDAPQAGKPKTAHAARKDGTGERFKTIQQEIFTLESSAAYSVFLAGRAEEIAKMPDGWRKQLREDLEEQKRTIREHEAVEEGDFRDGNSRSMASSNIPMEA